MADSGAVREIRAALRHEFHHTTLIAADDPQSDLFELPAERGVIEGSAAWVFDTAEQIVGPATGCRSGCRAGPV